MLQSGALASEMKDFITDVNKMKQEDASAAIQAYCDKHEEAIYNAIKSITITLEPSSIIVVGSSTTQTNASPIVLENVIQ